MTNAVTLNARKSADHAAKLAETEALLTRASADYAPTTQASSLGAEDVVITHIIQRLGLTIPIFVLETGALHEETLALLARTQAAARLESPVRVYRPSAARVAAFETEHGPKAMYQSIELRKACCGIRKLEPLAQALAGHKAWVTGLRREQSGARAEVPLVDESELAATGRVKLNPLARWTWGDVWAYIGEHAVDYNPLHDRFFPSIGCAPCTRAISMGEDFRAGRWWWEDEAAKECGLHVSAAPEGALA